MSCAADRGDYPAWTGKVASPREEITPEVDAHELAKLLLDYFNAYDMALVEVELEKALDQEFRRGVEEALAATRRYRPISQDETR